MSRAGRKTRRKSARKAPAVDAGAVFIRFMKDRLDPLMNQAPRSHAEFLRAMRAKQAAGKLVNPATAALIERLERAIHR